MNASKTISTTSLLYVLLGVAVHGEGTTNLTHWLTISNRFAALPTNEIIAVAMQGDAEAECYVGTAYFRGLRGFQTNHALGREWLLKSAEQNCAQAQNTLGWNAANGIGGATNYLEAAAWYRRSAALGFSRAEMNLARLYRGGQGVNKDIKQAVEWYRKSASHGLLLAKRELGFILSDEPGFGEGEKAEGRRWLTEAAHEGDASAQNRTGWNYWKGIGVARNDEEARRWFFLASRQGSTYAMHNLCDLARDAEDRTIFTNLFPIVLQYAEKGSAPAQSLVAAMYDGGLGIAQDRNKLIFWNEKAAAQDYGPAIESVGDWYYSSGPNQDRKKAFRYYQRAAAQGLRDAKGKVAELLLTGEGGVTNEVAGIEALKTAAEAGSIRAQRELADRYKEGKGVPREISEAIRWYVAVVTNQTWFGPQADAGMILGIMFATGDGVARDDVQAVRWFRVAARHLVSDAQDSLGYCYATGRGVERDDETAVQWFKGAVWVDEPNDNRIFYPGASNLGVMYATGRGGLKQDMEKAVGLFESAANHALFRSCNVPQAQTALAICLYEGRGVQRNVTRAFRLFQEAADQGNPQAQLHVGLLFWRGEGTEKNVTNAFTYLEAATANKEPDAAAWRDQIAKELTDAQRSEAVSRARSITTALPRCEGMYGHRTWNLGLRIPNLAIAKIAR